MVQYSTQLCGVLQDERRNEVNKLIKLIAMAIVEKVEEEILETKKNYGCEYGLIEETNNIWKPI